MSFSLTSHGLEYGGTIQRRFTCDGENVSPGLAWSEPPQGVVSYALIVDDPDAPHGVYTHWVAFNLPAQVERLNEHVPPGETLPEGGLQGRNDAGQLGYVGPCPPPGPPHRYRFALYALDTTLPLQAGASKQDALNAVEGHILGQAELIGFYQRF